MDEWVSVSVLVPLDLGGVAGFPELPRWLGNVKLQSVSRTNSGSVEFLYTGTRSLDVADDGV